MMRLYSNWSYLEQEFGCSIRERFLMAVRSLDNPKAVTPFLVETGGRRFGLFLHVEKGNVKAAQLPPDITPVFYRPYFTFEESERPPHVHSTLADALDAVAAGDRKIILDRGLPMAIASELATRFSIEPEDGPSPATVTLRQISCADTKARLGRDRPRAAQVARRLLDKSSVRARLLPYLEMHADERFSALDAALEKAGMDGVVVSSTLNVQEIAGIPVGRKDRPLAAMYLPGESHAWVVEPGRVPGGREFATPEAALGEVLPQGRIGVETEDVGLGLAEALGLDRRDHEPADRVIRQWRDENTLPDLSYYVIATRTTRHAIEAALEFAEASIRNGTPITEMDAYGVYLRSMREFVAAHMPGARVARTLTNFHSGSRTIFPANAAPHHVDGAINTLKIDAGCLLFDKEGMLLGCSDIARTLALSEAGKELYHLFRRSVRSVLIPRAAAGRTGHAMHADGANTVWNQRAELRGNPLFVDLVRPETDYDRDVGHLLGKNNLAHLRFVRGDNQRLREGMIACCEYQWPLRDNAIAYEDTCLVSPGGGLNLTTDEE